MQNKYRISIAMATYNGAMYLREQLDSIAQQELLPYELVITDDLSSDSTFDIVDNFSSTAPFPVRFYRNDKKQGVTENFFRAANLCEGEIIAFCDQDDVWLPGKLARCSEVLENESVLLCIHSAELIDKDNNLIGRKWPHYDTHTVKPSNNDNLWYDTYPGFSMVFKKKLLYLIPTIKEFGPYLSTMWYHDSYIAFLAVNLGNVVFLSDILALYRQHGQNTCGALPDLLFSEKILKSLDSTVKHYDDLARQAEEEVVILLSLAPNLSVSACFNANICAARKRRLGIALKRRSLLYDHKNLFESINFFISLLLNGGYCRITKGGLGAKGLIKDFIYNFAPWLIKYFLIINSKNS